MVYQRPLLHFRQGEVASVRHHPQKADTDRRRQFRPCHGFQVATITLGEAAICLDGRPKKGNEEHLSAPYVVFHDGTYYMFYCAGEKDHSKYKIHLATSKDLKEWTRRHPKNPMVVDGFDARDPFLMRQGDEWLMYYTAKLESPTGGNHVVAFASAVKI